MFRLLKLGAYAFIGYSLYQMYLGMTQGKGMQSFGMGQDSGQGSNPGRFGGESQHNPITGPGKGMQTHTDEASGMSASHHVGRGVVSR